MKKTLSTLALALTLMLTTGASAGEIGPALKQLLTTASPADKIAVIIHLKKLNVEKGYISKIKNRKLRRKKLIAALKEHSNASRLSIASEFDSQESGGIRNFWLSNSLGVTLPARKIKRLVKRHGVTSIVLDQKLRVPVQPLGVVSPGGWNLDAVGAPALWQQGYTGQGVVVATMDTGVDLNHPDIGPKWRGGTNSWLDPHGIYGAPHDSDGHGTQGMGLIIGGETSSQQIGMAPDAQWIAVKIFDDAGQAPLSAIHQGFQYLIDPDNDPNTDDAPDVVSNSWGFPSLFHQCYGEFHDDIAALKQAGIVIVFSAGNSGPGSNTDLPPANNPQSLSVGAVSQDLNVADFSSRGPSSCDGDVFPKIVAPGVNVYTTDLTFSGLFPNSYTFVNGTSFAGPHVAGAVALLTSAMADVGITPTVSEVETSIDQSAFDLGILGPDNEYGAGLLDVDQAHAWLLANTGTFDSGNFEFSIGDYNAAEDAGGIIITVNRSSGAGNVTVDYATSDVSATFGSDYIAASGTLSFLAGEITQVFTVPVIDDNVAEIDEIFNVQLSNPTGGAGLGFSNNAQVTILDNDSTANPDSDGDGFTADLDCNDNDASVYPGALEVKHDAIDQDCNGYDLTINIIQSRFLVASEKLVVWATSDLADQANLTLEIVLDNGTQLNRNMIWRAQDNRWQKSVANITTIHGGIPVSVTVIGIEGMEMTTAIDIQPDSDGDGFIAADDCNDNDAMVYPGALEIKHDAIDQDCNGYDLTIDVIRADYLVADDKVAVWATSDLGDQANLNVKIILDNGKKLNRRMNWQAIKNRWRRVINNVSSKHGGFPISATITGAEGVEPTTIVHK